MKRGTQLMQHLAVLACFAYIGCLLAACGGGDETTPAQGTCNVDGKPMPMEVCR